MLAEKQRSPHVMRMRSAGSLAALPEQGLVEGPHLVMARNGDCPSHFSYHEVSCAKLPDIVIRFMLGTDGQSQLTL